MKKLFLVGLVAMQLLALPAFAKSKGALVGQANINDATVEQLTLLPGVGTSRAQAIVVYRQAHPFQTVDDLKKIKGIGDKGFEKLKPFIALQGTTTLKREATPVAPKANTVNVPVGAAK